MPESVDIQVDPAGRRRGVESHGHSKRSAPPSQHGASPAQKEGAGGQATKGAGRHHIILIRRATGTRHLAPAPRGFREQPRVQN